MADVPPEPWIDEPPVRDEDIRLWRSESERIELLDADTAALASQLAIIRALAVLGKKLGKLLYLHGERDGIDIARDMLGYLTKIAPYHLRNALLRDEDWDSMERVLHDLHEAPFQIGRARRVGLGWLNGWIAQSVADGEDLLVVLDNTALIGDDGERVRLDSGAYVVRALDARCAIDGVTLIATESQTRN